MTLVTISALQKMLRDDYRRLRSWALVAKEHGISKPLAWRIAVKGYEPRKPKIRAALGLRSKLPVIISIDVVLPPNGEIAHVPRGSVIIQCANPACAVWFVRVHPRQKYHDKQCRKGMRK